MEEQKKKHTKSARTIIKKSFWLILNAFNNSLRLILVVGMGLFMLLQYPIVQTYLARELTSYLSQLTSFKISIEKVNIDWYDVVKLREVKIIDPNNYELINAPYVEVDYTLKSIYDNSTIQLDQVILSGTRVGLRKGEELNLNWFIRTINENLRRRNKTKESANRKLTSFCIDKVILENLHLLYTVVGKPKVASGFDPNHIDIKNLHSFARNFKIVSDTISCNITDLHCFEASSKLLLSKLQSHFQYNRKSIQLTKLNANIGKSILSDSIVFSYDDPSYLSDFIEKVHISANLHDTRIASSDLAKITKSVARFNDVVTLNGRLEGTVNDFDINNLKLQFGKSSYAYGTTQFKGLPNIEKTYMNFDFKNSFLRTEDLEQYLPSFEYGVLAKFGNILFNASFDGFLNNFNTKGRFITLIGNIETDVNIIPQKNYYKGKLSTQNFNLGVLSDNPEVVQTVSLDGTIEGTGFLLETADLVLDAQIHKLGLFGYDYSNIVINSTHLRSKLFQGEMKIDDPNLKMNIKGDINFIDSTFNFVSQVDTVKAFELGFIPTPLELSTTINANFKGLTPKSIAGQILIQNQKISRDNRSLSLDSLFVETGFLENKNRFSENRFIKVDSEILNLHAQGQFQIDDLIKVGATLGKEFTLDLFNQDSLLFEYYTTQDLATLITQKVVFNAELNEVNKAIRLFSDDFKISNHTTIDGKFKSGETSQLQLSFSADTLKFKDKYFVQGFSSEVIAKKRFDSPSFELDVIAKSANQKIGSINTNQLEIGIKKEQEEFLIDSKINHAESNDFLHAAGTIKYFEDGYEMDLQKTNFKILDKNWISSGINKLFVNDTSIIFQDMKFLSNKQLIHLRGAISSDPTDVMKVDIENFDIGFISNYIDGEVNGIAHLDFFMKDLYGDRLLEFDFEVDSIYLNQYLVGNLESKGEWIHADEKLQLDAFITRDQRKIIKIDGDYFPTDSLNNLDFLLTLNGASLESFQPFVENNVSNLEGILQGEIKIGGQNSKPNLEGFASINDGKFTLNYLNTTYTYNDRIYFKNGVIKVDKLRLVDANNHEAFLTGGLFYASLADFKIDLKGEMNNFFVLNTQEKDNDLFYGKAFGSGDFELKGAFDQIELNVNAKSEANTRIYIPILGSESVQEQDYITFIQQNKDSLNASLENKVDQSNIRLNFNVEITPDAYCEIIFDKKSGDIIRGSGLGKVKMIIDTKGEFSMFGDVEIVQGAYNFTMLNVIDKKFGILPNSKIRWSGDPYGADLDVTATYTQTASLAPIIQADSSILNQPEIRRRYPVDVLLGMKGNLLQPQVSFDIDIRDYPSTLLVNGVPLSLEGYVQGFEQRVESDEQELNRQVFSLILLKKLSPEETFSGISQSAGGSVSELLTNQLSYWVSQVDENLEIDLDLDGLNADALNTFQLRLSYSFMNGRLRVTRHGAFTNIKNETDVSSIFGDWTVEYLLSPDGKLRAKMYHKSNTHSFNTGLENNSTAGVSVLHTKSFNSFADIFRSSRKKKRRKKKAKEFKENTTKLKDNGRPNGN